MGTIRVGINGFGRVGRCVAKQALDREDMEVVAINDLADTEDLAYLFKYDSVHGWYPRKVETDGQETIIIDGKRKAFFAERDPAKLPWGELGVDVVIESTGAFRDRDRAAGHLEGGAKRVLISAPSANADAMIVYGVNNADYDPGKHRIVSAASCTTNCLAPVARTLQDAFGVERLLITTVHAYTSSQSLMDAPVRKRRRGRAAAVSIIPTTTGAAKATAKVIPELEGRIDGMAMRVPVPDGSVTDIVATLSRSVGAEEVNDALRQAADSDALRGVMRVSDEALVSRDVIGDHHSSIVDEESTMVVGGDAIKVLAWYDNEWGYSARLIDMVKLMVGAGRAVGV